MARAWAVWAVIGWHKQAEMEFRCRNDVDLESKEPKIDNQCGLSQIDTIRASDIWRGRHYSITRDFLNHYDRRLEQLFGPDPDES